MELVVAEIFNGVVAGDRETVQEKVQEALDSQVSPQEILNDGLIAAMSHVGELFEQEEYFVVEMLMAAKAMQAGMALLKPTLVRAGIPAVGKVALGTVRGDQHDIGKNLVGMMLEGAGFEVIDLGSEVSPDSFVETVRSRNPDIIGMSALLTTTMLNMRATIEALKTAGLRDQVKVMVGGAPVNQAFADQIGADGYADNAMSAVRKALEILSLK